jgi:hypothetical protein
MAEMTMNPNVAADLKFDLAKKERAQRKTLITVAEWTPAGATEPVREILGARTEDSSIEFNADIATSTDILGVTYTDVNKTEPQQTFDPFFLLGGSKLGEYLVDAAIENRINDYNGKFDVYIIAAFINDKTGTTAASKYKTVKHAGCSIIPTSLGGDAYVSMPIEVHYSNDIKVGTVDKLADDFVFTPTTAA